MSQDSPTDINDSLRIRPVDACHVAELMRIADQTNLSHWSAESYLDELKNPDAIMLRLVDDENSVAGFVVGRIILGGEVDIRNDAEIYNIAVTAEKQRNGLGQVLLDAFIDECRSKDAEQVWLEVRESNHPAIGFYKKNGFEYVQTRNHFYEDPREHALLMRLDLKDREG
jgi:ribosomal-protein-alanine N-acetyltransferase